MSTVINLASLGGSGFVIEGGAAGDFAGYSIAFAGDVNGDGFDDIIIGAPYSDPHGTSSGNAYVIYGHAHGFGTIDLANLQPSDGFRIQGAQGGDFTGLSVSAAGDVNGDGFDDIIVATDRPGGLGYGDGPRAFVIFGAASHPTTLDLGNFTASDGFVVFGPFESAYYRSESINVSSAGDINGDGFDDIIFGTQYSNGFNGAAYVVYGHAHSAASIDVSNLAASDGFAIRGQMHSRAGTAVSGIGDINHDGFDDFAVFEEVGGTTGTTAVGYVFYGSANGLGTVDLTNLQNTSHFTITVPSPPVFDSTVAPAGDVNGDGYDDFIVGSFFPGAGQVYVIFGGPARTGNLNLTALAPSDGFVIQGATAGDSAGFGVSAAGDVNHDGFADILIGATQNDAGGADSGSAYIVFGHSGSFGALSLANLAPSAGIVIRGAAAGDFAGWRVAGGGDFNGDGASDVLVATPWGDLHGNNAGQAYLIFGTNGVQRHVTNDFNGDGRSDILLRNDNGTVVDWLSQPGGTFASNAANSSVNPGTDWHVAGTGDFNGDGFADILWRNDIGTVVTLLGQPGGGFAGNVNFNLNPGLDWHVAGTGDFNGDDRSDILWRSDSGTVVTFLGQPDGSFVGNVNFNLNPGPDWHIAGTGDFDGDGRSDILWRNDNGNVVTLLGQTDGSFVGNVNTPINPGLSWHVAGTGDFNGDGRDDILWRNDNGAVMDYLGQANATFAANPNFSLNPGTDWHVAAIGDYNGDGRDDILWRNDAGTIIDFYGQANGTFVGNLGSNFNPGTSWHVEPQPGLV